MHKFTARQLEILELIRNAIEQTGFPPTRAEISAELGFRSANAAEEHLQALARKGAIEISPGTSRGIKLLPLAATVRNGQGNTSAAVITLDARAGAGKTSRAPGIAARQQNAGSALVAHQGNDHYFDGRRLTVPLVGQVAAGAPILASEHIDATYSFDPGFFASEPDFLLRVKGASMRDAGILDGDLLAVRKTSSAVNGQIVVARLGDDVTVKRFQRTGTTIELLPENPDFKPIVVSSEEYHFELEGLVVGLVRRWQ